MSASAPRCPICGSPPAEVDEVEVPSGDRFRRYEKRYTCPNLGRDDHQQVAPPAGSEAPAPTTTPDSPGSGLGSGHNIEEARQ